MNPKITVIICTRNRINDLKKCIDSILKSDFKDFEILVVNDASTDNTKSYLKSLNNPKIRFITNKKSKGLCVARNKGIKNARGKYVLFTDDDCIVEKKWISKMYASLNKIPIVAGISYIGNSNKIFNKNLQIVGCNMGYNKNLFKAFRFDPNIVYIYDESDLYYRLIFEGYKFNKIKAIIRHFVENNSPWNKSRTKFNAIFYYNIKTSSYELLKQKQSIYFNKKFLKDLRFLLGFLGIIKLSKNDWREYLLRYFNKRIKKNIIKDIQLFFRLFKTIFSARNQAIRDRKFFLKNKNLIQNV